MKSHPPVATAALRVGEPDVAGPLAVFPLFGPEPRLEYRSFAEAAALGASVRELAPEPSVNDLVVDNPLDVPVLLYEGEEVQGAQQDRTFDVSILVPAGSRLEVPVSCVEAGRWDHGRHEEDFAPAPQTAYPELRRAKSRAARLHADGRADQSEVWALVGERSSRAGEVSPTGAMRDLFDVRRDQVDALRAGVTRRDEQVGAVAFIAGRPTVIDVVGRADVFAALHASLVSGYALDALEHGEATSDAPSVADAERFVTAALAAPATPGPTVGLGRLGRFAARAVEGARLDADGELVALTAFPSEHARGRVRRPSRRR